MPCKILVVNISSMKNIIGNSTTHIIFQIYSRSEIWVLQVQQNLKVGSSEKSCRFDCLFLSDRVRRGFRFRSKARRVLSWIRAEAVVTTSGRLKFDWMEWSPSTPTKYELCGDWILCSKFELMVFKI